MEEFIGLEGTGNDTEFKVLRQTERAMLLQSMDESRSFWMPKSAFDGSGNMLQWAYPLLRDKLEESQEGK